MSAPAPPSQKSGGRSAQIVITIGVTLVVALVATFFLRAKAASVTASVVSFDVRDDSHVTLEFDVSKAYDAQVTCSLVAQGAGQAEVGRVDGYVVGPQADRHRTSRHTVDIPTTSKALTAFVESCVVTRDH